MKFALIVVDMLLDTFDNHPHAAIVTQARSFLPRLNNLIDCFHRQALPVIFACDSFLPQDFIFQGKMKPHSLRGTPGEGVIAELHRQPEDIILPKRRFSAFYKTDLDQTLRTLQAETVLVAGIATPICVLTTALDAVSNDFRAILVEDCCAAHRPEYHHAVLEAYRQTPLFPLLQVVTSEQCIALCTPSQKSGAPG